MPGDFDCDEALGDVSRFHVKMVVDRADLAGDGKAQDRLFYRVEHTLFDIALGASLVLLTKTLRDGLVGAKRAGA